MFYNFKKNKKAFTLVELIVVIAIIAILGAVVGVTVSTFLERAKKTDATSPLSELAGVLSAKESGVSLAAYIKELYPKDYSHFYCSDASKLSDTADISGDFNIYYHNDNSGKYWGKLEVKGGIANKKITALESAPGTKTAVS